MTQTIKIKRSTGALAPTTLAQGELAYSKNGNKLYIGDPATVNTPILINEGQVVGVATSADDILSIDGSKNIAGVDAGSDQLVFWDDSLSKLAYGPIPVNTDVNVNTSNLLTRLSELNSTITLGSGVGVGVTTSGNLTVTGNLTVEGVTTTLETTNLNVEDKNITLNFGAGDTSASASGAGLTIQDAVNATTNATMLWDTGTGGFFDFSNPVKATATANTAYAGTFTSTVPSLQTNNGVKVTAGRVAGDTILLLEQLDGTDVLKVDGLGVSAFTNRITVQNQDVTGTRIQNWQAAHSWGDHAAEGYLTSVAFTDINGAAVRTSAETFGNSDSVLMTEAAIDDLILAKSYGTGDITAVTAGIGLSGGGTTGGVFLATDLKELADMTDAVARDDDEFILLDRSQTGQIERRKLASEIDVSVFDTENPEFTGNLLILDSDHTGAALSSGTAEIQVERGDSPNAYLRYNHSLGIWQHGVGSGIKSMGTITSITGGNGINPDTADVDGAVTIDVDLAELTDMTATMVSTDEFIVLDNSATAPKDRRKAASEISLAIFDNSTTGFTSNVGDITGLTVRNNSDQGSADSSIVFGTTGASNSASVSSGSATFRLQVGTIDGGTY